MVLIQQSSFKPFKSYYGNSKLLLNLKTNRSGMKTRKIGIMGAMPEEVEGVVKLLSGCKEISTGMRTYYSGDIDKINTVIVFSRWGKVAAATTVSTLIHEFGITELFFTGAAGAIHPDLNIGDIVLGKRLIQHDMDARPLMKRYEIPLLHKTFFDSDAGLMQISSKAVNSLIEDRSLHRLIDDKVLNEFNISNPRLVTGDIASGDQFFSANHQKHSLQTRLPDVLCVEMEGAAVAQVCYEYGIPFVIIRTISDTADDRSHIDFPSFIKKVSSKYSTGIIKNIYDLISG